MDAQFGHLFSTWRHHPSMDLSAYRYNHNMMEYYTCKSKFKGVLKRLVFKVILLYFFSSGGKSGGKKRYLD